MANKKIKKVQVGTTTYDLAVNGIDKVEGLRAELDRLEADHQMHSVDGQVLVIGEESDNSLTAKATLEQVQVGTALYNIKDTTYEAKTAKLNGSDLSLVTTGDKYNWNTHISSAHAPADAQKNVQSDWTATSGDAYIKNKPTNVSDFTNDSGFTKVEASTTNGKIKINGTETTVYTHPTGTNPHGTTKSDVGLSNVGNFKAVSTVANQGLTDTEKSNARANIGAGTSSLTLSGTGSATTAAKSDHTHDYSNTYAAKSHTHGNINNSGQITATESTTSNVKHIAVCTDDNGTVKKMTPANVRSAIGAGTSSLTLAGTGNATTAAKSDHTHDAATATTPGFMSSEDKAHHDKMWKV